MNSSSEWVRDETSTPHIHSQEIIFFRSLLSWTVGNIEKIEVTGHCIFSEITFFECSYGPSVKFCKFPRSLFTSASICSCIKIIVSVTQDIPIAIIYNVFMVFCEAAACYHIVVCSLCCCLHHIKNMLQKKRKEREKWVIQMPQGSDTFQVVKVMYWSYIYIYTLTHMFTSM